MIAMNNTLIDFLQCHQRTQNNMTDTLQAIHKSLQDHADDSWIEDIPTFDGTPELYFDWIVKLEITAAVTKWTPKDLALGKSQDTIIQWPKFLPADAKDILKQQFSCFHI